MSIDIQLYRIRSGTFIFIHWKNGVKIYQCGEVLLMRRHISGKHKENCMGAKLNIVTDWPVLVPWKSTKYLDTSEHIGYDAWTTEPRLIPMIRACFGVGG